MKCCKCGKFCGVNPQTIHFGPNKYGHFECFKNDLDILGITQTDLKKQHPENLNSLFLGSSEVFTFIFEALKKELNTISIKSLKSYKDNTSDIQEKRAKFLALKRICIACGIDYKEKVIKFYSYNARSVSVGDKEKNDFLAKIDFFGRQTGVIISVSQTMNYTPSSECIYIQSSQ